MNKVAAYQAILEDHPLWQKEAEKIDWDLRHGKGSRERAAAMSALGGSLSRAGNVRGIPVVGLGTASAAIGAQEGRRTRAALGHVGGRIAGTLAGAGLSGGRLGGMLAGDIAGGALGTYLAHGKNLTRKQIKELAAQRRGDLD